ncbi:protein FAM228A isoform X1 [Alosa sapidissima]|uniref:protein FAM228A isoform X1 n=2 Tax=Alosa sapidissima TaxID=34773 RepID=UPI001C09C94D|nr:protein FAM228A isoform X1 [Alosa sapidissima]XP_041950758.1 protein FAM228A isoform X1 [Alosa sapidissima]
MKLQIYLLCVSEAMPLKENMGVITVHKKVTPACLIRSKSPVSINREPLPSASDGRPVLYLKGKPLNKATDKSCWAGQTTWISYNSLRKQLEAEQQDLKAIAQPLLDTENTFVKRDVEQMLCRQQTQDQCRRELLYKCWSEEVWTPIQRGVEQHMAQVAGQGTQRLRSMLLHYIHHCNAKGYVFLDTYDPQEYNPFLLNTIHPYTSKVTTPALKDPLFIQSRDRIKEKRVVLRCQTGQVYTRKQVEEILRRSLHPSPRCRSHDPRLQAPPLGMPPERDVSPWRPNSRGKNLLYRTSEDARCYERQCWSTTRH